MIVTIQYTPKYSVFLFLRSSVLRLNKPIWVPTCCHYWRIAYFFRRHCHHLYHLSQPDIFHLWINYRYLITNICIVIPLLIVLISLNFSACFVILEKYKWAFLRRYGLLSDFPAHCHHPLSVLHPPTSSGHSCGFHWRVPVHVCSGTR